MNDKPQPLSSDDQAIFSWAQRPGEPDHWFSRFDDYAKLLGSEFSVRRAYLMYRADMVKKGADDILREDAILLWQDAAVKYQWAERAREWMKEERHLRQVQWERRRQQLMEDDWTLGGDLRTFAKQVLETFVISREVGEDADGNKILQVQVTASQLSQLVKSASDLQRLSVGEPTDITGRNDQVGPQIYLPKIDPQEGVK